MVIKLNSKYLAIAIIFGIFTNIGQVKADRCGGGDTFLASMGGSFLGSTFSNFMCRPRQQEVVVVQQPAPPPPAPIMPPVYVEPVQYAPAPRPYQEDYRREKTERIERIKAKKINQELELQKMKLDMLKEENRKKELDLSLLKEENKKQELALNLLKEENKRKERKNLLIKKI